MCTLYVQKAIVPTVVHVATHFRICFPTHFSLAHKGVHLPEFLTNWDIWWSDVVFCASKARLVTTTAAQHNEHADGSYCLVISR